MNQSVCYDADGAHLPKTTILSTPSSALKPCVTFSSTSTIAACTIAWRMMRKRSACAMTCIIIILRVCVANSYSNSAIYYSCQRNIRLSTEAVPVHKTKRGIELVKSKLQKKIQMCPLRNVTTFTCV